MLLSIITINYNNSKGLVETIESVLNQDSLDYEYIIIDGSSTDDSLETILNYKEKIDLWISEPDDGIYDAMNKGIERSNGDFLLFLNSGDIFYDNHVLKPVASIIVQKKAMIYYGDIMLKNGGVIYQRQTPKKLTLLYLLKNTISHQATFIKREFFQELGKYETSDVITADWQLFFKAFLLNNFKFIYLPVVVSIYNLDGISSSSNGQEIVKMERQSFLKSNFPNLYKDFQLLVKNDIEVRKAFKIAGPQFFDFLRRPLFAKFLKFQMKLFRTIYKLKD